MYVVKMRIKFWSPQHSNELLTFSNLEMHICLGFKWNFVKIFSIKTAHYHAVLFCAMTSAVLIE